MPLARTVALLLEDHPNIRPAIELTSLGLSILAVVLYVVGTYGSAVPHNALAEIILGGLFLLEWAFFLWISPSRFLYLVSLRSNIDLATSLPAIASAAGVRLDEFWIFRIVRLLRMVRMVRYIHFMRALRAEVNKRIFTMGVTMFIILVGGAGLFYEVIAIAPGSCTTLRAPHRMPCGCLA